MKYLLILLFLLGFPPNPVCAQDQAEKAAEMLKSAERVMAEVEELRGWKFKQPVHKDVQTVEQLRVYIEKKLFEEEYGGGRLERTEAWLQALGLMPAGQNFKQTVMDVLLSQIGGFYDAEKGTFFMMVGAANLGPFADMLIAHELCHALDDQYVELDSLMDPGEGRHLTEDESFAVGGVVEGSATALMYVWMFKAMASGELDLTAMMEVAQQQEEQSKILLGAPPYFALIAANYLVGRHFITKGEPLAANMTDTGARILEVAKDLPRSSEQLLHPDKYWDPEQRDEPVRLANEELIVERVSILSGRDVLHRDTIGELVCALMGLKTDYELRMELMGQPSYWTNKFARGWGGDRLFLVGGRRPDGSDDLREAGVVWVTAWDTAADREEFVTAVRRHRGEQPGLTVVESGRVAVFGMGSLRDANPAELRKILEACEFTADGKSWTSDG